MQLKNGTVALALQRHPEGTFSLSHLNQVHKSLSYYFSWLLRHEQINTAVFLSAIPTNYCSLKQLFPIVLEKSNHQHWPWMLRLFRKYSSNLNLQMSSQSPSSSWCIQWLAQGFVRRAFVMHFITTKHRQPQDLDADRKHSKFGWPSQHSEPCVLSQWRYEGTLT